VLVSLRKDTNSKDVLSSKGLKRVFGGGKIRQVDFFNKFGVKAKNIGEARIL
jgi:hypothetical protein